MHLQRVSHLHPPHYSHLTFLVYVEMRWASEACALPDCGVSEDKHSVRCFQVDEIHLLAAAKYPLWHVATSIAAQPRHPKLDLQYSGLHALAKCKETPYFVHEDGEILCK